MHEKIFLFIKKYFLRREKENNGQKKRIFQFIVNLKKQMLQIFLVVTIQKQTDHTLNKVVKCM